MDLNTFAQLNAAYHNGVYEKKELEPDPFGRPGGKHGGVPAPGSGYDRAWKAIQKKNKEDENKKNTNEEYLDIQEWVEALIDEGYDLDQYSDEELYEAYMGDLQEAKGEGPQAATPGTQLFQQLFRGSKKVRGSKQARQDTAVFQGKGSKSQRRVKNIKEELDLYDLVSEYLVAEGFCDSYEDADVIMANMSEEWREGIVEEVLEGVADQSDKQIDKGIATTYNASGVLVNQRSPALNYRVHYADKDDKIKRMKKRIENRRKDLFKEKDRREDEKNEKLKKMLGL
jgi:hypothetical protein